jgi:hypothetical protein
VNGQFHSPGRTLVPTGYEDGRVPDVNGQLPSRGGPWYPLDMRLGGSQM